MSNATPPRSALIAPRLIVLLALLLALPLATPAGVSAASNNLYGPAGSGQFGYRVTWLPNGNLVVTDLFYDNGSLVDAGAAHLYDGTTMQLISTLTSDTANSFVGDGGIVVLEDGNYLVLSSSWDGALPNLGAVTWCSATSGCAGVVSSANSLVGSSTEDRIANRGVQTLPDGRYLVISASWNGTASQTGAVTWCPAGGCTGEVSSANSLVGSSADDQVGSGGAYRLANGNYVICSSLWDGGAANVGAATWADGTKGITGTISSANSLTGSSADDQVGSGGAYRLANGHYVVGSQLWDGGAANVGAVTWGDGTTGITGTVSSANSLTGSTSGDQVGSTPIALTNGHYVVGSPFWDGVASNVGAVTWADGTTGITGTVSSANSLTGSTSGDQVGLSVTKLANGHYVVGSPFWDGVAADVGAATWGDGTTGITGTVSSANSLTGSSSGDNVGDFIEVLANGHYVVGSPFWDGVAADVGAATWADGTSGITGTVSSANSLTGSTSGDGVGNNIVALTNGNYVVASANWDGVAINVGAVTWADGTSGITGTVSSANSLTGSSSGDRISNGGGVTALTNGNYVVGSPLWDGVAINVGAATWGDGTKGITGTVSAANSLVGSTIADEVGSGALALTGGGYLVRSSSYTNAGASDAGAISWSRGSSGLTGSISTSNSVLGTTATQGSFLSYSYDATNRRLAVGRPYDNIVTIMSGASSLYLPLIRR